MSNRKLLCLVGLTGVMSFESGAFAAKLGHAGTSVKGATTPQNQVNLIADPADGSGTITSLYNQDPVQGDVLSIADVTAEPGFAITEVDVQTSNGYDTFTYSPAQTNEDGAIPIDLPKKAVQAGAVQVSYVPDPNSSPLPAVPDGMQDGVTVYGDYTYIITFNLTALGLADEANQTPEDPFMVELSNQPTPGGFSETQSNPVGDFAKPDTITTDGTTYTDTPMNPNEIEGASATFQVEVPLPEPTSLSVLGISGVVLLRRTRRVI
jgi:hypothetical protein